MKIIFLVLALVLVTVNGELLLRDVDEADDALLAVDDTDDADEVDDALLAVDDTDDADEVDDALPPFEALDRAGDFKKAYITGNLVKLGTYYPKGIPLSVLFTFDTDFVKIYGTTGMNKLIQLTKKNLDSKTLKNLIGTTIKLTGTARKYNKAFSYSGKAIVPQGARCRGSKGDWPCTFAVDAPKIEKKLKKKYNIYQYVQGKPKSGAGGVSKGAGICMSAADERISFINAPTQSDCTADKVTNCDSNYKLSKLAKTAAHEIGHVLGMDHDFDTQKYNQAKRNRERKWYYYRKYNGKSCAGGFMSYQNMGKNGWSACSARDMSRMLTKGGKQKPCTFGGSKTTTSTTTGSKTTCGSSCLGRLKDCMKKIKPYLQNKTCSGTYTACRRNIDSGRMLTECAKGCKSTKKMIALKSNCGGGGDGDD